MTVIKKLIHNGSAYYSVGDAARYLNNTTNKIREMMGNGDLEWTQFHVNGRLVITAESLADKKRAFQDELLRR